MFGSCCGARGVDHACGGCGRGFHLECLNLSEEEGRGWRCTVCVYGARKAGGFVLRGEDYVSTPQVRKNDKTLWPCRECLYFRTGLMQCSIGGCRRLVCFECACVDERARSWERWRCLTCAGLDWTRGALKTMANGYHTLS